MNRLAMNQRVSQEGRSVEWSLGDLRSRGVVLQVSEMQVLEEFRGRRRMAESW